MRLGWLTSRSSRYKPLPSSEDKDQGYAQTTNHPGSRWQSLLMVALLVIICSGISYSAGQHNHSEYRSGLLAPAGTVEQQFVYNRVYSMAPTDDTVVAWQGLFPDNGGFIHHPKLASNFSGIAVFHQLHCLHALYNLYYNANSSHAGHGHGHGGGGDHDDGPEDTSVHARHCFDYLRQALMCHADTNLEPYDYRLNGVTGWGQKTCRDYSAVFKFANQWGGSQFLSDYDE